MTNTFKTPQEALHYHVTGAIERGEKQAIVAVERRLELNDLREVNRQRFATVYAQAFQDSYPELPVERTKPLIEKAISTALQNIKIVSIDGAAFKLTAKRLGIKHTYKAFEAYLSPSLAV